MPAPISPARSSRRSLVLALVSRLLPESAGRVARLVMGACVAAVLVGFVARLIGGVGGGVAALWCFTAATVGIAVILPLPRGLVSPLYMGVFGWLVDMLPFVILAGWGVVVLRWVAGLARDRRLPSGGRWVWLPVGLVAWTALGVAVITTVDFKHFLLLLGIQVIASGAVLIVVDTVRTRAQRVEVVTGLVAFVALLSGAVLLQWVGVPIQALQDSTARRAVEEAYGVDAFPNNVGMIKYARSIEAGALELRRKLEPIAQSAGLPPFEMFRPKFQAYENSLVVRFGGSARDSEEDLSQLDVTLLYDNIGLAPANTVPRLRSFPRNALTYAGVCAAVLPLAFFLVWTSRGRRRVLGRWGVVACLFGAGFSLARGSWVAIAIGVVYAVFVCRALSKHQKRQVVAAYIVAATVLTGVFLVKYGVDPLNGRAGGGASVNTRADLYQETLDSLRGVHILLGYGTERPRTESGTVREGTAYVPRAGTHSTYLNYLFRAGLPGALGIMALYGLAILHAHKASSLRHGADSVWAGATATAVVAAAAHGVILSLYVEPIYTLAVSIVLGLAMAGNEDLGRSVIPWRLSAAAET